MNLVGVKSTLKDSSHGLGAKDTDLVEGLSGAKERGGCGERDLRPGLVGRSVM